MPNKQEPPVIYPAMLPRPGMSEIKVGDLTYLQRNDAMFTGTRHGQGEFSDFFLALRDEARIFGHRCPECRHLIIPPFMKRCPACNFAEMSKEYVKDVGVTVATPVITVFAPSRFKDEVPFGTGRVYLETAEGKPSDTAVLVRVRTTRGTIRPGIFGKGTPVKIVFRDQRRGRIDDVFALPQSELTPEQLAKSPLLESEIEWGRLAEELGEATPERRKALKEIVTRFATLADMIPHSARATANLANWRRTVNVETGGGSLSFVVKDGTLRVQTRKAKTPDLIVRVADPAVLLAWLRDCTEAGVEVFASPALTDLVIDGTLILNKPELETITRLDRIPRSLRRDHVLPETGGR